MAKSPTPDMHGKRPRRAATGHSRTADESAAQRRIDGKSLSRNKTRLTMYLDTAVVEYFRSRSGGRGYQTMINEALKQAIERENLEDVLRRVIREEARPYKAGKG
jgi:uncharacterized protein (DUF4415 family)